MAIIDSRLVFGENIDVGSGSTKTLPDRIDFTAYDVSGARDAIARGEPVWWVCLVGDRGTGGTSLRFRLRTSTLGGTEETLVIGRKFAASELFSGLHFVSSLPVTSISPPHFLFCRADMEGTFSGLKVTAYLTATPPIFSNDNFIDWR